MGKGDWAGCPRLTQGSSSNNNDENDWVLDAKKVNVLPSVDEERMPSTNDYPRSVRRDTEPHTNLTLIILEMKRQMSSPGKHR